MQKLDGLISQLNVEFNPNAIKAINEISQCMPVEGVAINKDEFDFPSESIKDTKPPLAQSTRKSGSTTGY